MRRRWFFLGGVLLFFMGLWVLEARPGELVPNEGGRTVAGDFFKAAIQPAVNFEDPEMQSGKVSFFEKLGKALWLTVRYALVAMSLALVIGIVGGILGSRAWWSRPNLFLQVLRIGVRLLATAVRSVHELMWALLFLSAIGTSPLAAVFAMALPYGGTLAKVFSELLDEGENSAAEVIRVSGGGGFTAFFAGVVTNALPDLATYALYRLECAIRSSAVLGFVGIPTLGYEIKTAYEDGHYREIWTYLYALLVLVVLFEWWGSQSEISVDEWRCCAETHGRRLQPCSFVESPGTLLVFEGVCRSSALWSHGRVVGRGQVGGRSELGTAHAEP